jgi:hypothetical protein
VGPYDVILVDCVVDTEKALRAQLRGFGPVGKATLFQSINGEYSDRMLACQKVFRICHSRNFSKSRAHSEVCFGSELRMVPTVAYPESGVRDRRAING